MRVTAQGSTWLLGIFTLVVWLIYGVWASVAVQPDIRASQIEKIAVLDLTREENSELIARLHDIAMRWEVTEEFPPISANDAIRFCDIFKHTLLSDTTNSSWHAQGIELVPIDHKNSKWCWVASFGLWPRSGGVGGMVYSIDVFFGTEDLANAIIEPNMPNYALSNEIAKKQREL